MGHKASKELTVRKRHTELSVGAERRWGKGALPSAGEENRFLRWDEVKDVGLVGRAGREGVGRGAGWKWGDGTFYKVAVKHS